MGIMTSFYYTFTVWITICVKLISAEPVLANVSAHVGSTAVLPCKLPSVDTEMPRIIWSTETEIVFERLGEDSYQGEGYEGRVDVPEDELRKGNCSLVLHNLTLNDADVYKSHQMVKRTKRSVKTETNLISRVELSVDEKPTIVPTKATDESEGGSPASVGIIVFGVILLILVIAAGIVYWYRKKQKRDVCRNAAAPPPENAAALQTSLLNEQPNPAKAAQNGSLDNNSDDPNKKINPLLNTSPDDQGAVV